jgi:hypothetical protein
MLVQRHAAKALVGDVVRYLPGTTKLHRTRLLRTPEHESRPDGRRCIGRNP